MYSQKINLRKVSFYSILYSDKLANNEDEWIFLISDMSKIVTINSFISRRISAIFNILSPLKLVRIIVKNKKLYDGF